MPDQLPDDFRRWVTPGSSPARAGDVGTVKSLRAPGLEHSWCCETGSEAVSPSHVKNCLFLMGSTCSLSTGLFLCRKNNGPSPERRCCEQQAQHSYFRWEAARLGFYEGKKITRHAVRRASSAEGALGATQTRGHLTASGS